MSNKYNNILSECGTLDVRDKSLTSLYELPIGIIDLMCVNNFLEVLPELPDSLKRLWCSENELVSIPKLPDGLEILGCNNNDIKYLPNLPEGLKKLYCHENPLECLIPSRFLLFQRDDWMDQYYYPYINSYVGQKNILSREPWMAGELIQQAVILDSIREEFGYLINGCELNLL